MKGASWPRKYRTVPLGTSEVPAQEMPGSLVLRFAVPCHYARVPSPVPQNSQLSLTPLPLLPEFLPHPSPLSGMRGLSPRKGRKRDQWPEINRAINKSPCSQSQEKCYFKVNQSNFTQSPKCNLLHTRGSRQAPEVQEHSRTKSNSLLWSAEGERRLTGQRQWSEVTAGLRQHGHLNRVS